MGHQAIFRAERMHRRCNPLKPIPRYDKSKGNGEMRGFFAPLRMTDTLTHPCRNATRVGWWVVVKRAAFGFASPYCAGLGSAFFAMAVGLGFQKVGSALIHSSAG